MQCSNCQFENMPGVTTCGRCGAGLQLASAAIDVHPPRASRAKKFWRRWFPIIRYWNRWLAAEVFSRVRIRGWPADLQTPGVLLRMIVPGWAQRCLGRRHRARWMFFGFLGLLGSGLFFFGTAIGWLLLGLAISLHAASVLDIVASEVHDFGRRMAYSCVAMLMLFTLLYWPVWRLTSQVVSPQRFNVAAPPFAAGDVVLVNPSAFLRSDPQPGDVVIYALTMQDIHTQGPHGEHMVYRFQGDRVDRILARGGQRVTFQDGRLSVDGQPSSWLPLGNQPLPEGLDVTVPPGAYLIPPSTVPIMNNVPQNVWQTMSIVTRGQIGGLVYWQSQPLSRFGPIH